MSQLSVTNADENILKTALAFVVLRQRVNKKNAITEAISSSQITDTTGNRLHRSRNNKSSNSPVFGEDGEVFYRKGNVAVAYSVSTSISTSVTHSDTSSDGKGIGSLKRKHPGQDFASINHDPGPMPFLRRIDLSALSSEQREPLTESEAKRKHISTMFRISLSSAHPLYVPFITSLQSSLERNLDNPGTDVEEEIVGDADDDAAEERMNSDTIPSIVYDCKSASWTCEEMKYESLSFPHAEASSSPSISIYLALDGILTQLACDLNSFNSYLNRQREMHHNTNQELNLRYKNGIVSSLFIQPLMEKIFCIQDGNMDGNQSVHMILTMCTVLQRIAFLDSSSSSSSSFLLDDILVGICGVLKTLYYQEYSPIVVEGQGALPRFRKIMIQLPDILAVNCLVLLEEIISLKLSKAIAVCEQSHGVSDFSDEYQYHGLKARSLSDAAGDMLNVLNVSLGELVLPIPVQEMAAFSIRDLEARERMVRGEAEQSGLFNIYGQLDGIVEVLHRGLNTGAKMMLRMSLFDLVQKLSSSHIEYG